MQNLSTKSFNHGLIKQIRQEKGLKQDYVAHLLGISPYQLSRLENGKNSPTLHLFFKLSSIYELSLDDMVNC